MPLSPAAGFPAAEIIVGACEQNRRCTTPARHLTGQIGPVKLGASGLKLDISMSSLESKIKIYVLSICRHELLFIYLVSSCS